MEIAIMELNVPVSGLHLSWGFVILNQLEIHFGGNIIAALLGTILFSGAEKSLKHSD